MNVRIEPSWGRALAAEWDKPYFRQLTEFIRNEYARTTIYPPAGRIFAAFDACPFDKVKVVILGQDPYHGPGQANGLAFSVNPGVAIPRSLINIFKEVHDDTGAPIPANGDLTRWARQGVLLLNSSLTVVAHSPGSHQQRGWEELTDEIIAKVASEGRPVVFMLWGKSAQEKKKLIRKFNKDCLILESNHPSPLSALRGPIPFIGNDHFRKANEWLVKKGISPINWTKHN